MCVKWYVCVRGRVRAFCELAAWEAELCLGSRFANFYSQMAPVYRVVGKTLSQRLVLLHRAQ
eukprot:11198061-Lingulodinium_polyedra.AAC.1